MTATPAVRTAERGFGRVEPIVESFDATVEAAARLEERDFRLAGADVRLRSPHPEMLRLLCRAHGHLELAEPAADPDLTVNLWDAASGGRSPPLPDARDEEASGAFFYFSNERLRAGFQLGMGGDARGIAADPESPSPAPATLERLSVLERSNTRGWYWVADADRIPWWEQAAPLLYLLDWWLRDRDMQMLHGAAVGTSAGGVLLVGKSGSGKSTAALASIDSDLLYAGDDYVGLSLDPEPQVHGLYGTGKLMQDHVDRLPFLLDALANGDRLDVEKAIVYVNERWPEKVVSGFPLRAILIPRITPGLVEARVVSASAAAGLTALAPSTVLQMHTRGQDSLVRARRLVERVPSYVLELGSDISSIPRTIRSLVERLDGAG